MNIYKYGTFESIYSIKQTSESNLSRLLSLSYRYIAYTTIETESSSFRNSIQLLTGSAALDTLGKVTIRSILFDD